MRLNVKARNQEETHEGGVAFGHLTPLQALRRSVMSCLLWENEFYESGQDISARITDLAGKVSPLQLSQVAIEARHTHNLRHVPLLLLAHLCRTGSGNSLVADTIAQVINRADELSEFVAVYAGVNGVAPSQVKKKLSAQAKKGLARAFGKFDEYQLAKYSRDSVVKLRDVLFLCHAKPSPEREGLYKRLIASELATPDTWEVALSGGADKNEVFTRLLKEGKLGYFALLRNLRNMTEAGVDCNLIEKAILEGKGREKILPFRYIAAARACPQLEPALDRAMQASIEALPRLKGRTVILVDVSGSMDAKLSGKSDLRRIDAAAALASIANAESLRVFTFSNSLIEIAPRRGMAGVDACLNSQPHGGTELRASLEAIKKNVQYDRIIIITDEQSHDGITQEPGSGLAYLINVASAKNGVGYGKWTHLDGFSENVLKFIYEHEKE